ncbi:MAG: murein biosynthesis integral membrane protein MurJ [Anaerolineae bacterium]
MSRRSALAKNTAILMASFIISRVLGLGREAVIGYQFGTNPDYGAYLAAFRVPDLLFNVIGAGAIGSAFIPVFAGLIARDEDSDAWKTASAIMNIMTVMLVALAIAAAFFSSGITNLIVSGFSPEEQALTSNLVSIMLLSPVLFAVSGLVTAILQSYQRFLLPALAPIVYNLAIIFGALVLAPHGLGVHGLAAGVVLGAALHLGVQIPGLLRLPSRYSWTFGISLPSVREVTKLIAPRTLGLAAVQLNFIANVNLASHLDDGPARVAALSYAWIIMLLPQGIFALSIANAIFPTFSAQVARGEHAEMKRTLASLVRLIAFVTIPASAGLYVLRTPIIQLLLQRGSFSAESTALTADALQYYALGLVPHSMVEILTRAFYALHDTLTPVLLGLMVMGLNILLSFIFIGPMQQGGLALANSLATGIEMVVLGTILWRRMGGLDDGLLRMSLVKTALATLVMVGVLIGVSLVLPSVPAAIRAIIELIVGAVAFFVAALVLGSPELSMLQRLASRFAPRLRPTV